MIQKQASLRTSMRRRIVSFSIIGSLAVGLANCSSMTPEQIASGLGALDAAFAEDVAQLEGRAAEGDARSQFAMSIVLTHGLRGRSPNLEEALALRQQASAPRGFAPITTYIAGLNGQPGQTSRVYVPVAGVSSAERAIVDACIGNLSGARPASSTQAAYQSCGGADRYQNYRKAWDAALAGA